MLRNLIKRATHDGGFIGGFKGGVKAWLTSQNLKFGFAFLIGSFLFAKAYPTLYSWELLPFVQTDAYKRKAALMDYSGMDGIVYDAYDKGTEPPRSQMLPTSKGQSVI